MDKLLDDAALADRKRAAGHPRLRRGPAAQGGGASCSRATRTWPSFRARRRERGRRRRDGRGAEGLDGLPRQLRRGGPAHARTSCATSPSTCALRKMGDVLEGPVPVPQREDAVLQRAPGAGRLPLLRLRRGRRRLQVRDAARAGRASPRRSRCVARRFGMPVPERRVEPAPDRKEREELLALLEAAAAALHAQPLDGAGHARRASTCSGRGFQKETLEKIRAGAARDSWDDLLDALRPPVPAASCCSTAGLVLERRTRQAATTTASATARVFPILNDGGQGGGLRRAQPRRQRAQVPELAGEPRLPEEPRRSTASTGRKDAIRTRGPRRADGGLPRRGARARGGRRRGGRHLRHRAHRRRTRACCGASPTAWW